MIEVDIATVTGERSMLMQRIDRIQCESYDIEACGITFFRMRFINSSRSPHDYYASFFIPVHTMVWMSRRFVAGQEYPNYDLQ